MQHSFKRRLKYLEEEERKAREWIGKHCQSHHEKYIKENCRFQG